MEQISSAEIADIMIRADCYLTVTEITTLAKEKYHHLHVSRVSVTNIIRHFVRSSRAICELDDRVYPRKYWLHGLNGYQFKVRGRTPEYGSLLVKNCSRKSVEQARKEQRELVDMANKLWNAAVKKRGVAL